MKTIEVVAAVIYDENNNFLIAKRKGGEFDGMWEFPGGKIEKGETHKQALIRELKEELSIDVKIENFIKTIEYSYDTFYLIMHVYKTRIISKEILLNVHSDLKWINKNNIKNINWVPADVLLLDEISK